MTALFKGLDVGLRFAEMWFKREPREVKYIPDGARKIIVGGLELLGSCQEHQDDLPDVLASQVRDFAALVQEHVEVSSS